MTEVQEYPGGRVREDLAELWLSAKSGQRMTVSLEVDKHRVWTARDELRRAGPHRYSVGETLIDVAQLSASHSWEGSEYGCKIWFYRNVCLSFYLPGAHEKLSEFQR
jgi:hypothetical protein